MLTYFERRSALGLVIVALAVVAAAWPAGGAASARGAGSNTQTFTDPTGDSATAPDVSTVTVSNDDSGLITFAITLANRPSLSPSDYIGMDMDTDGDLTDGSAGMDYFVAMDTDGARIYSLAGGGFASVATTSFTSSFANGVQTVSINAADIGNPKQINFRVWTDSDNTFPEDAPDNGLWTYQVTIAAPTTVNLAESKPLVSRVLAGRTVTVSTVVTNGGEGIDGSVICNARVGSKALAGARRSSISGKASCSWRLPGNAHGKQLRGTIGETYGGQTISRPFSARVK